MPPRDLLPPVTTWRCTGPGGKGCPCRSHRERRDRDRVRGQLERAAALLAASAGRRTCPKRWGSAGVCGGRLEDRTDGNGRHIVVCLRCERHARGYCVDCPRPITGRAMRCRSCKQKALQRAKLAHYHRHGDRKREAGRNYYRNDPVARERRNKRRRLWALAHPEQVPEQQRRTRERRAKGLTRHRLVLSRPTGGKESPRQDGYRLCIGSAAGGPCDVVMPGKRKKCRRCVARDRQAALAALAAMGRAS